MRPKKVIILMHYMALGGAEISLIGLLQSLDYSRVDVDLFIYRHEGELMRFIPKEVNLLPENPKYACIEAPMKEAVRRGQFAVAGARLLAKLRHRHYRKRVVEANGLDMSLFQYVADTVTPMLPDINPNIEYDLAISFLIPHNICRDKVRAKKKIAWIHTDYSTISVNAKQELPVWSSFDYIASISPDVTRAFLSTFPSLKDKICEIENILSSAFVRERAKEFLNLDDYSCTELKLLSIGRYVHQKNFDNVPNIARRVIELGIQNLKWFIIGYGGSEELIRQKIFEAGMEEHVILLGKKENPYPYIKACDIYVQPSRYEGKSVTVREAQMLCKPVVVSAYPTAPSQIEDGVTGVIVPLDNEGCARGLADFIADKPLQERIAANLAVRDFGNIAEIEKIHNILQNG